MTKAQTNTEMTAGLVSINTICSNSFKIAEPEDGDEIWNKEKVNESALADDRTRDMLSFGDTPLLKTFNDQKGKPERNHFSFVCKTGKLN
jgi:hypothetical protein